MATQIHDTVSIAFRHFMTEICIFLSFYILASKSRQLLITANTVDTNQFQREFLFNNCIHSQNLSSASKPPRQKTNFLKQRRAVTSRRRKPFLSLKTSAPKNKLLQTKLPLLAKRGGVLSLRAAEKRVGVRGYCHFAPPTSFIVYGGISIQWRSTLSTALAPNLRG
jgi:hypothetical protein